MRLRFALDYPLGWLGLVGDVLKQVVDIVGLLLIGYALVRP